MKKYLKFAGVAAALVALIGWILVMACPAVKFSASLGAFGTLKSQVEGSVAIFGNDDSKLAGAGLVAWLFTLLAFLVLVANFILPLVKVTVLEKYAHCIDGGAAIFLLVAGICSFCVKASWMSANGVSNGDNLSIGAGWVIGGILLILAAIVAVLPTVFKLIEKK